MTGWIAQLTNALAGADGVVLVTVAHVRGSTPRDAGTVMIVAANAFAGTIGGGHLEFEALRIARAALAKESTLAPSTSVSAVCSGELSVAARSRGDAPFGPWLRPPRSLAPGDTPLPAWIVRFPLAARLGQCCGGVATLAFLIVDRASRGWVDAAAECERSATPFALVTPLWDGAPAGGAALAPLLVTADDVRGSLGSAALDSIAIDAARKSLASGRPGATLLAAPNPDRMTLLMHVTCPDPFAVLVFGNGHVGHALIEILQALPVQVRWIDSREHDFPAPVPANVEVIATDMPEAELAHAPRGAFIIILTHSHALDFALIETALARDDWRYLGLIGSRSKRAQFEKRLAARGIEHKRLARIVCPIGAGIGVRSKEPGAIAVAVAAELLTVREAAAQQGFAVTLAG